MYYDQEVAKFFGLNKPTRILLDYQIVENKFGMNFLPDVEDVKTNPKQQVINIDSSDNESDHHTEVLPNESSQPESDMDTEEDLEEENDGFKLHSRTKKVTRSMANLRKKQVLTFPNHISRNVLANTDQVLILSDDTNFVYQCKIHSSTRSKDYGSYESI
ncbi:hypothetical protein TSUD_89350 [Trifolium subterraneum]|uniref:Uncharacterized protein n=1 Tax=Trifolium subterraneum TaxID=3900 RepID=A0A2Z6M2P9_TRISU|nr:hypothetical protein TSUD_89350 [Trifolium subterraneum]